MLKGKAEHNPNPIKNNIPPVSKKVLDSLYFFNNAKIKAKNRFKAPNKNENNPKPAPPQLKINDTAIIIAKKIVMNKTTLLLSILPVFFNFYLGSDKKRFSFFL